MIARADMPSGETDVVQLRDDLKGTLDESDRLRAQVEHMAAASHNLSELLLSTNLQNERLLTLLISVRALVESSSAAMAVQRLCDLLVNVVGIEEFVIYALDHAADRLVPIGGAGEPHAIGAHLPLTASWIGDIIRDGELFITRTRIDARSAPDELSAAVVPLKVMDRVLGAIVITRTLAHRPILGEWDRDILALLGAYAATAIIAADQRSEWTELPASLR